MTTLVERLDAERAFHDVQAGERAETFTREHARLRFVDSEFLDHETWIRPAFAMLGDLAGKQALDYGCGHGMASVVLARAGAMVTAFDLSPGYVSEAQARAEANGVIVRCVAAPGEDLPFADASFDVVWGNAILHHLDLPVAMHELKRVMKPGAVAVFAEPWGGNWPLEFARQYLPYPGKHRTRDEQPLRRSQVEAIRAAFPNLHLQGFQLFGMAQKLIGPRAAKPLHTVDGWLLPRFTFCQKFCRYMVLSWHNR
jgi:2-polyprenyl-3-methyl-5-hydroxy-6-metoxy-1,4-benzoquinol methylase